MRRARPPRAALLIALALVALSCKCGNDAPPPPDAGQPARPPARALARLQKLEGQVEIEREEKPLPAVIGSLYLGDILRTGPDGVAVIRFSDGRQVELNSNAEFVISEDSTGIVLEVKQGILLSRVPAGEGGATGPAISLNIRTPFGLTRLGSDQSEVKVDVGKDKTQVEVKVGRIEFVSRNGESSRAGAGDTLDVSSAGAQLSKPKEFVLEPIQVTLLAGGGKADIKKQASRRWRAVGREGEVVDEGDSLRIREGTSILALGKSQSSLAVEKGGEIVFEKSERRGNQEESHFDVKKGALVLNLAADRKSRVVLGNLTLESEQGGQFDVARTRDGLQVDARVGDVTLGHDGASQLLQAGQTARLGKGGSTAIVQVARAEILLPARTGARVYHSGLGAVSLGWEGRAGDYVVEVATDSAFEHRLLKGTVHQPFITLDAPRRGSLYWRAFSPDGKTELGKGGATFSADAPLKDLARLRNEVLEGSEKTTIFYQDKPPAVTLICRSESEAAQFRVQLFPAQRLDRPLINRTIKTTTLPLSAGELSEGGYVWSCTPLSASGEELRGGKMNKLELAYDNSVPRLIVTSPKNGDVAHGGRVRVAGIAPIGSKLLVNGKSAPLDEKSRFELAIAPIGRPPMVIFHWSRPSAADAYTVRILRRGD